MLTWQATLVWGPSALGSLGFLLASYVYLAEVTHSYNPLARPREGFSLGYLNCLFNLLGSLLFLVASLGYFVRTPGEPPRWGWQYQLNEWGVRFTYGVGSALFLLASLGALVEIVHEADPIARHASAPPRTAAAPSALHVGGAASEGASMPGECRESSEATTSVPVSTQSSSTWV